MKDFFSIGELAALFGLNIQTLYYYDSIGIFSPKERNERSGRRKYDFDQIYELATVCYMRRLGYSLDEIKESRTSLNSSRAIDNMKQRSGELRRQWQELLNIDDAIQRKIRFMEQEMDGIRTKDIEVKHFNDRRYISIGEEELLYKENSFYFYPTIAFYEGDRKYFGAYLYPEDEEIPPAVPKSRIQVIRGGDFLCGYHLGEYENVPDTIRRLREYGQDRILGDLTINFNILDQFVESDSRNFITSMQIRVLDTK